MIERFRAVQSWRKYKAHQQPEYPDEQVVKEAADELSRMPPLVFAGECRNLQARLAKCATGESFWLQGAAFAHSIANLMPLSWTMEGRPEQAWWCRWRLRRVL